MTERTLTATHLAQALGRLYQGGKWWRRYLRRHEQADFADAFRPPGG